MQDTVSADAVTSGQKPAPNRALVSWALFDWSVQPFYTLVVTFLFGPYFVNAVAGTPAHGQELWGYAAAAAGVLIAFGSPYLGAMADGRGRRKPWVGLFAIVFMSSLATLWIATPGADTTTILIILTAFVLATAAAEFSAVFSNAIMPGLVPPSLYGRLSGIGWAVGYAGGLVSLILMAGLVVSDPSTGKTLLGFDPLLKLDAASREGDRLVGPFAAIWFAIFIIPFFLFVPDARKAGAAEATGRPATAELWDTVRSLPSNPSMMLFLVARMIYSDGLSAIFAFGGIYGGYVFGWGAMELGIFGIVLTVTGIFGALVGGHLDDRIGSKAVIIGALVLGIVGAIGILSVDKTHIFFTTDVVEKVAGSKPFSSVGEQTFLAFAILIGIVSAPIQSASRALLARLAPPDKMTQYFGLFAFSGKVTAFLAPLLVAFVTGATGDQRLGMASILAFLIVGMLLIMPVRVRQP